MDHEHALDILLTDRPALHDYTLLCSVCDFRQVYVGIVPEPMQHNAWVCPRCEARDDAEAEERDSMACRRCSICVGMTHHWVEHLDEADPPTYTHHCKHCETVGMLCDDCDAEGCETCDQEGVIPVGIHPCDDEC